MCQITDKFVQEGIEIGYEIGYKIGYEKGYKIGVEEAALNLAKRGIELEAIAEIVNENVSLVKQWLDGGVLSKI